jgi:hypothetical protein
MSRFDDAIAELDRKAEHVGRLKERVAILAWLERQITNHRARNDLEHGENLAYQNAADAIERGDHLPPKSSDRGEG